MATSNGGQQRQAPMFSTMSALWIFGAGGMSLAYGVGWNQQSDVPNTTHLKISWFIGVCAGAIIAAPLINIMRQRFFMFLSSLLVIISGIIFVVVPTNYAAIIAARYINGIAIGLTTVSFLVFASEVAYHNLRGICLSTEQYTITIGIAIQIVYDSQWPRDNGYFDFEVNVLHGILIIIYAVIAFGFAFAISESPIFYIRRSDEPAALESLRRMETPRVVTDSTRAWLAELNAYVSQNEYEHWAASIAESIGPLFKMLLYRSVVAFSFSLPLNEALIASATVTLGYSGNWMPIVFIVLRVLGAIIGMCLLDRTGRKCVALLSLLIMAALVVAVGGIFINDMHLFEVNQMTAACTLLVIMQLFAGLYVPSASTYLGEAFPLLVKPYLIALCIVVENVIQIVIICSFVFSTWHVFLYGVIVGVIMLCCFCFFYLSMPETRNITLKEAQDRFGRFINPKLI